MRYLVGLACVLWVGVAAAQSPGAGAIAGTGATAGAAVGISAAHGPSATFAQPTGLPGTPIQPLASPPPASVTTPPFLEGVPPTPAPARPGLPAPPPAGGTASSVGQDVLVTSQLRPGSVLGPTQIAATQQLLAQAGFYSGPLDGTLSGTTRAAIRAFQASANLPPTGQLDLQTLTVLGALTTPAGTAGTPTSTTTTTTTTTTPTATNIAGTTVFTPVPGVGNTTVGAPTTSVTSPMGIQRDTRPFPLGTTVESSPAQGQPIFIQP
jgi:peptidoglycan hydrolase-like protein with peptidoglycan-binding domain